MCKACTPCPEWKECTTIGATVQPQPSLSAPLLHHCIAKSTLMPQLLHFLEEQVGGHVTLLQQQKANPLSALIVPKHHRGVIAAGCLV